MSVAEFSQALRNKALVAWFNNEKAAGGGASKSKQEEYRLANINVLVNPVKLYRTSQETSEKTAFIITEDTVRDLIVQFHGVSDPKVLEDLTKIYFSAFRAKTGGIQVSRRKITVGNSIPAVYFPNISFDSITKLVNNVMNIKAGELSKYYEKGHVIGLTTELLQETANRIRAVDTTGSTGKAFLLQQLNNVIEYYKRLDLASANLQPAENVKLYATFDKKLNSRGKAKYLVELQPKATNQGSAKEVQATLGTIKKIFSPGNITEEALLSLIDSLKDKVSDSKFQQDLLNMKSSPSFKHMIRDVLVGILSGAEKDLSYTARNVYVGTKKQKTADLSAIRKEAKKKVAEATKVKAKLNAKPIARNIEIASPPSTTDLLTLLNANLYEQIKKNMGTGSSRDVLNFRSGRLARSASVERISESRNGMITAFYTYMKNPYATFSVGGAQQFPKSRDPKLLISKSIREIAATQVQNRLRAVLV